MELEEIQDSLDKSFFRSCIFGSQGEQEKDIALFGNTQSIEEQLTEIKSLLLKLQAYYSIITKREHIEFADSSKIILHFLYYPTLIHFKYWELPSFGHYLFNHAHFMVGKPEGLEEISNLYINNADFKLRTRQYQLFHYCEMALHTFIYSIVKPFWWNKEYTLKTIQYLIKYITIELVMEKYHLDEVPFNDYQKFQSILHLPVIEDKSQNYIESTLTHLILVTS